MDIIWWNIYLYCTFMGQGWRTLHLAECITYFELQFRFLSFQFSFLWGVANSILQFWTASLNRNAGRDPNIPEIVDLQSASFHFYCLFVFLPLRHAWYSFKAWMNWIVKLSCVSMRLEMHSIMYTEGFSTHYCKSNAWTSRTITELVLHYPGFHSC